MCVCVCVYGNDLRSKVPLLYQCVSYGVRSQCECVRFYSHLIGKALPERVDHFRVHTKGGTEASVAHNVRGLGKKEEGRRKKGGRRDEGEVEQR